MEQKACKVCSETRPIAEFKIIGPRREHTCRACKRAALELKHASVTELTCRVCAECKPKDLFKKNGDRRSTICKACDSERVTAAGKANPEAARRRYNEWVARNPERSREIGRRSTKAFRENSPEKAKAAKARYRSSAHGAAREAATRAAYVERNREALNQKKLAWMKANKHRVNAATRRRAAGKLQATPAWANEFFIEEAYHLAQLRTAATGFLWSVDHIVPMISERVCGLHTEQNLQVIPHEENRRKNNRFWPDMPT